MGWTLPNTLKSTKINIILFYKIDYSKFKKKSTTTHVPCKVFIHSYPAKSHNLMERSEEHEASVFPDVSNDISFTASVCPFNVRSKSPLS